MVNIFQIYHNGPFTQPLSPALSNISDQSPAFSLRRYGRIMPSPAELLLLIIKLSWKFFNVIKRNRKFNSNKNFYILKQVCIYFKNKLPGISSVFIVLFRKPSLSKSMVLVFTGKCLFLECLWLLDLDKSHFFSETVTFFHLQASM